MTNDSLRSLLSGLGDPLRDKAAALGYVDIFLDDRQIAAAYRNSWLARKIVNIPALDAFRKWRHWKAEQEDITKIEAEEKRLGLKQKLLECKTKARLWGGAAIFIKIKNQPAEAELDPETVKLGDIEYLTVLTRKEMAPDDLDQDPLSQHYGWPKQYMIHGGTTYAYIHPSRMIRMIGEPLPDPWGASMSSYGWGDSTLQSIYTTLTQVDSVYANIASLVFEAKVDKIKIPGFTEKLANKVYRDKMIERYMLANIGKSINNTLMLDAEEEWILDQISFAGLPDVVQQFVLAASGAADIPITRLFGQSPSGLSATGEHDMKNYHDRIASIQTLEIDPACDLFTQCLLRSALGSPSDEIFHEWTPLEQMSEKEQAEIGKMNAETAAALINTGLFMPEEMRNVVGNQLVESGFYPGLADKLKENGDDLPEFDLERRSAEASTQQAEKIAKEPTQKPKPVTKDASPRSMYMRRDVLNAAEILKWFRDQGVPNVYKPESLHVTIVYSKTPFDWLTLGESYEPKLEIPASSLRVMEKFGDQGDVLVMAFNAWRLQARHDEALSVGASYDYPNYQPHISISLSGMEIALENVKPWTGKIVLGPEIIEEIDLDKKWKTKVKAEK